MAEKEKVPGSKKGALERGGLITRLHNNLIKRPLRAMGWKSLSYEGGEGRHVPEQMLGDEIRIMKARLRKLKDLENRWPQVDKIREELHGLYQTFGQYTTEEILQQEGHIMRDGDPKEEKQVPTEPKNIAILGKIYKFEMP